ncbi:MAG TPA: tRNA pseudouridine(55) synthase TruB [Desulfobulbus sp.]|nr:tRNA pseudouridine(55) synthase TruB [Desulfobulbus sp.]HHD63486.1 tRNA pseudouridine(55) synthase TruB [Desulfobulbaceae bacterium]
MVKWEPVQVDGQPFTAGVVLIDKPPGITSFGVVRKVRRLLGVKKVGHAGTLDPFASGLLIICAGRGATKNIDLFMQGRKIYQACLQLGMETETQDPEGTITSTTPVPELNQEEIDGCLQRFVGPQLQAPPPFSAAKYRGKPLYYYARKGVMIHKEPKAVEIYSIVCQGYDQVTQRLECEIVCSRGTYIRVLAADIGEQLGYGAYLRTLRRTRSGNFAVEEALACTALDAVDGRKRLLAYMMDIDEALTRCSD